MQGEEQEAGLETERGLRYSDFAFKNIFRKNNYMHMPHKSRQERQAVYDVLERASERDRVR